ncbi:MAG TPA: DedA family protein [Patescibacteria group bacterium]|nr:DedA family protein [Patescibacteria group bacterium]
MLGGLNIDTWVASAGILSVLAAIGIIVFAESGLLVGIFLPGDSLLLAAGFFAAQGTLPLIPAILVIFVGAILGDNAGYVFGKRTGPRIFRKREGLFFRREYIQRAEAFFKKHGPKTVLLARFVPYVRTFTPIVAGVARMQRSLFIAYNIVGALLWTIMTVMIGYWLSARIPHVERYVLPAALLVICCTFGPLVWQLVRRSSHMRSRR